MIVDWIFQSAINTRQSIFINPAFIYGPRSIHFRYLSLLPLSRISEAVRHIFHLFDPTRPVSVLMAVYVQNRSEATDKTIDSSVAGDPAEVERRARGSMGFPDGSDEIMEHELHPWEEMAESDYGTFRPRCQVLP